jgi:hypothetical protein
MSAAIGNGESLAGAARPGAIARWLLAIALLVVAVILALIGVNRVKKATETDPNGVRSSLRHDVDALKGVGEYDN